ncbi:PREDICTED: uncharacterized protein LOC105569375 [Vollenhovia emeryi]|uniref:uncharacterized protein LOC105569375 n=1 Tax=Vollenhovia emeryi TaxID=411798 RepID=UPI0005F3A83D|nr:PREDICTED: uncharacterized protein LOC105569375 [Vollenhovia emeryi]
MDLIKKSHKIHDGQSAPNDWAHMTKYEAVAEQHRIVNNWKPRSDVWPLAFTRGILVGASTITAMYINHRFRARLKLRDYGLLPTMMGVSLVSATATGISHTEVILNKLMSLDIPCAMCMESTSALMQTCSGLLVPLILTPLANFSITSGSSVYNTPYIKDVRKIFSTILSVYRPMFPKLALIFTFHSLLAGSLTYLEIRSYLRVIDLQYLMQEEQMERLKQSNI